MLDVERWAEMRREHFVRGVSIKELVRRTGLARNTIRVGAALGGTTGVSVPGAPVEARPVQGGDPSAACADDPRLPGVRVRELIEPLGFDGAKTIVDDYLREVRPLFLRPRTHQRTVYRPGEICQWDLWEPSTPVPVGHGQTPPGWVVVGCLGYSRAGAGALVFSKEAPDVLWGMGRCLWSLGALPQLMVWDREGCLHAGGGRPTEVYAALLRAAAGRLVLLRARRSAGEGRRRAPAGLSGDQLRAGPAVRQRARLPAAARRVVREGERPHAQDAPRAPDRPAGEERTVMRPLPARRPDVDRRWVTRVPPDPYLRFDTNDYSLDPEPGRPPRRGPRRASARSPRSPSTPASSRARHERCFAKNRTITALEHARALRERRGERERELVVEQRPLAVYDGLIA